MKKVIVIVVILSIIGALIAACDPNPTVTYYRDSNGNGREDWGEAVYFEDENGVHFFD